MTDMHSETNTGSLVAVLREVVAVFNPANLWQALRDADEGVCLMVPVRVRSHDRRQR